MIERLLQHHVMGLAKRHPVVTVTGPRQAGKTTLCRMAFGDRPYVSLETPAQRDFAHHDPERFLDRYADGVILDEIQRVPDLLSYIQVQVDEDPRPGRFVLTGSQNLGLIDALSQSLAGRVALATLLPLALEEMRRFESAPEGAFETIWTGGYPRILDRGLPPAEWLANYLTTYVERDVRQVLNIGDLLVFQTFLRMCAGRAGQLLNLSALGADCGVTHTTAKKWLSVLEATFIVFRLPPFHANFGKRLVKTPKLYFHDSGVLCHLLGIEAPHQLATHPLRGAVFENWVVSEVLKYFWHRGQRPQMSFYRDHAGGEVDLLIERGTKCIAVEIKSGATPLADFATGLARFEALCRSSERWKTTPVEKVVVYSGAETQERSTATFLSWSDIDRHPWLGE